MGYKTIGALKGSFVDNRVVSLTADTTLTEADLGTIFILDSIGEAITIPDATAMADGGFFEFHVSAAIGTTNWTITSASDDMAGVSDATTSDDLGANSAALVNVITLVVTTGKAGTWCRVTAIGDIWVYTGCCETAEGLTFA